MSRVVEGLQALYAYFEARQLIHISRTDLSNARGHAGASVDAIIDGLLAGDNYALLSNIVGEGTFGGNDVRVSLNDLFQAGMDEGRNGGAVSKERTRLVASLSYTIEKRELAAASTRPHSLLAQPELHAMLRDGRVPHEGDSGVEIRCIRMALSALAKRLDDRTLGLKPDVSSYDADLQRVVARFQLLYGLPVDGATIPRETLDTLSAALDAPLIAIDRLKHPLLCKDAVLTEVMNGLCPRLGDLPPATQATLKTVLSAPQDASLPAALRAFRRAAGLPNTFDSDNQTVLDARTMAALDSVGTRKRIYPEYERMDARGVREISVAFGYLDTPGLALLGIEAQDKDAREEFVRSLSPLGFVRIDPGTKTDTELAALGIQRARAFPGVVWFHRTIVRNGSPVNVVIRVIDASTPQPLHLYDEAMAHSDIPIYVGHGRYGIGPDFDRLRSPAGNYVMNANAHPDPIMLHLGIFEIANIANMAQVVGKQPNALEKTAFERDRYQLAVFIGCSTDTYIRPLRSIPLAKSTSNLDVIATTRTLLFPELQGRLHAVVAGVLDDASFAELTGEGSMADGIDDNPIGINTDGER